MAGMAGKQPKAHAPCDNLSGGSAGVGPSQDLAVFSWVTRGVWGWHHHGGATSLWRTGTKKDSFVYIDLGRNTVKAGGHNWFYCNCSLQALLCGISATASNKWNYLLDRY